MNDMSAAAIKTHSEASNSLTDNPLREFIRVEGLVERVMQHYFARFGISGSQWGLLRVLHRAEEEGQSGLRLTDLSDRLLIRPPSVTGAVDRLERAGLVARDQATIDQRSKLVGLTPKGRELIQRIMAVHGQQIVRVLGGLTKREQAEFHRLLRRLGQHLEGLVARGFDLNGN
jgi:DNA-binding MarR family transcriptional regulator